ncbi:hypothetical protein BH20ACT8_BH20ACT8_14160 [soil metagenome]
MVGPFADSEGTLNRMTEPAESLLRGALALPKDDRADLAAQLLVSLDETTEDDLSDVDEQWARELEARARRALDGRTASEDWVRLRDRLANELTDR